MPWLETSPVEERIQFIDDALSDRFTMSDLCARYGVSRRIGYKWLAQFAEEGKQGLANRSRAPHSCPQDPHKIRPVLAELLCEFRQSHPDWGARKLLKVLRSRNPEIEAWSAASDSADLLARRGLVRKRRRRHAHLHPGVVPISTVPPNSLWTADFKGQFRTGNGVYCYPLTIADQHTRFLLTRRGLLSTETLTARPVFERAFREYGLPFTIRRDNARITACLSQHTRSTDCRI
jgi:putative transposase